MSRFPTARPPALTAGDHFDPRRRRWLASGLAAAGGGLFAGCGVQPLAPAASVALPAVPPFSLAEGSTPPAGWKPYIMRPDRVKTVYSMERRDGSNVLHAVADTASSGLSCAVDIDPQRTPWLRWRWRADEVAAKASVAEDETEDTPARLVIAFAGDTSKLPLRDRIFFEQVELFTGNVLPYATLTYVWDGTLPVGSVLPYTRSSRIRYDVVESGSANVGRWLAYERNVLDDFRRIFGEPTAGHITSVGVLTDSDDLKTHAEAWYGDIGLYPDRLGG